MSLEPGSTTLDSTESVRDLWTPWRVLINPQADFSQANFAVAAAIDGNPNDANTGWAVSPATGVTHWATFEAKEPFGKPGGTRVTVKLIHRYQNTFLPGRFRLSVTKLARQALPERH